MLPEARQENLLIEEVGEELVVYDQDSHRAHRLNRTAGWVWQHCDGRTSLAQLSALVATEFGLPTDEEVVWLALQQLEKIRFLQRPLRHTTKGVKVSRRELVRRLGLASALALLLPMVTSITAPTPAMAQNPPPPPFPPPAPNCRPIIVGKDEVMCGGTCPVGADCQQRIFGHFAECVCVGQGGS
jgi:coenzyme PQQ synthesis protein D (PqqD)